MKRNRLFTKRSTVGFFMLAVLSGVTSLSLGVKLPQKIREMNEVKATIAEIEEKKEDQEETLNNVKSEVEQINAQVQSMKQKLEEIKASGLQVDEGAEEYKHAYLTFDDGPSQNTIKILDFLKANNIKATFFVIGNEGYDDIYKRIVDEGHTLAIHSNTHDYSEIYTSVSAFMKDMQVLSDRLEALTGVRPTIMRFPGGSNNTVSYRYGGEELMDKLIKAVNEKGYTYFDWNVDSSDASSNNRSKEDIVNGVISGIEGKEHAIILMHDAAAKKSTVEALPQIVEELRKKGYVFEAITKDTPPVHFKK